MKFRTRVELHGRSATGLPVPPETVAALAAGGCPAAVVTLGGPTHRTSIGTMGGQKLLPLSAENRSAAGVVAGEEVEVDIKLDTASGDVEVPEDLAAALAADSQAGAFFAGPTSSQRREWVRWVTEAKQAATRARRAATTIEALHAGRKTRSQ